MPEDEVRASTMELKLAHEAKLRALLETVSGMHKAGPSGT